MTSRLLTSNTNAAASLPLPVPRFQAKMEALVKIGKNSSVGFEGRRDAPNVARLGRASQEPLLRESPDGRHEPV